jgi:hypothetical protein
MKAYVKAGIKAFSGISDSITIPEDPPPEFRRDSYAIECTHLV